MSADREFPSDIAFTDTVEAIQEKSGSRSAYARMEQGRGWQTTVTPDLVFFLYDSIATVVQHYVDGAKSGRGDDMKPAFHKDATIFGYVGDDLLAGPIQQLFAWNDDNGPATKLRARIASIDLVGTVAVNIFSNYFNHMAETEVDFPEVEAPGDKPACACG